MKPYITFCIPSYNSEGFLHYALDSLISGENIEVLIIDDGSKDGTLKIAQEYEAKYPAIFKAVHQENKGHGGAINTALSMANGTYFKVLDSDDWVDEEALKACLDYIKTHNDEADLILMDYVYWQGREHRSTRIHFNHYFKPNEPLELKEVKHHFKIKDNITLHSAMYKTEVVRKSGVVLPEHCSYEDNLFVYSPLPYVDRIAYLPVGFYQYLIGRPGQSMTNETMRRKYKDFILCGKAVFDSCDIMQYKKTDKARYRIMRHHLILNCLLVPFHCQRNGSKEAIKAMREFLAYMKEKNKKQYRMLRHTIRINGLCHHGAIGRWLVHFWDWAAHKVVKFS
jgi:glycosyltransferase involved in cell wall biosynthesis